MIAVGLGGGFVNYSIAVALQDQYEEVVEEPVASTPEPIQSDSGSDSESSSSNTGSSNSSLNDDREAAAIEAKIYFDENYYCRAELIYQLEYDGFTNDAAVYGVDSLGADWLFEAMGKADWFEIEGYTYEETLDELYAAGCTQEEAEYAVSGFVS
jgi:hypothetical protein